MTPDLLRRYLTFYRDLGVKNLYRRSPAFSPRAVKDFPEPSGFGPPFPSSIEKTSSAELAAASTSAGGALEDIRADIGQCERCPLHKQRRSIVFGSGNPEAKLVFVGEGPGADEDEQGLPFVGRAGQLLTQMIEGTARREGIPLERKDVYICNVVKCRPPGNRAPEPNEMEICGKFLFRQLEAIRPKAICALGSTAARTLLKTKDGVTRLRGKWQNWRGIPVMVTFHPSYLLRPYNQEAKKEAWDDLKKTLHYVYD